jgi:hypothetical protein
LGSSHWYESLWFTAFLQEAVEKKKGRNKNRSVEEALK